MRNRVLNIGVAILALSSLPSCTTDPVDEADDESAVGLAEGLESTSEQTSELSASVQASDVKSTEASSSNDDDRSSVIVDDVITPLLACGFTYFSYVDGWSHYAFHNCGSYTIRRQVVKLNGNTGPCLILPPNSALEHYIYGYIVDKQPC